MGWRHEKRYGKGKSRARRPAVPPIGEGKTRDRTEKEGTKKGESRPPVAPAAARASEPMRPAEALQERGGPEQKFAQHDGCSLAAARSWS